MFVCQISSSTYNKNTNTQNIQSRLPWGNRRNAHCDDAK